MTTTNDLAAGGTSDSVDLGRLYAAARARIGTLVSGADGATRVPATPEWDVPDVVAHLRFVVADALTGNMEGAPGEAWTASHIARGAGVAVDELVTGWNADAPGIEGFLSSPAGANVSAAVVDVLTHECDLRGALGAPALDDEAALSFLFGVAAGALAGRSEAADLPAVCVTTPEGDVEGPTDAAVRLHVGRLELARAALGRRTPAQIAALGWTGDGAPYAAVLPIFGPRAEPLVE